MRELGAQIGEDYADRDLLLVALLKASFVFLADLSRAIKISHQIDFVELAGYGDAATGGHSRVRLLQDTAIPLAGLDVLLVEDVVDRADAQLPPAATLAAQAQTSRATLLDRPTPRLVNTTAVDWASPSRQFNPNTRLDIDERYRNLPDLRLAKIEA